MLELRQQLKTASVSNKGGEKESDRLKKELDKARYDSCLQLDIQHLASPSMTQSLASDAEPLSIPQIRTSKHMQGQSALSTFNRAVMA